MAYKQKRAEQGKIPYSALKGFIWVFSATILRPLTSARSYATIADRKRQNSRCTCHRNKTNERKLCAAGNMEPSPKRISGDGSAPPRFRFGFPCCSGYPFRGVCLAAAARSAAALVNDKLTPNCHLLFNAGFTWKKYLFMLWYIKVLALYKKPCVNGDTVNGVVC